MTNKHKSWHDGYKQGTQDYKKRSQTECPYSDLTDAYAWQEGYEQGYSEARHGLTQKQQKS